MSTDSIDAGDDLTSPTEITLTRGESGELWIACDEETGVASQRPTRKEALENLDEAVALYRGEIGREPTDEELRELGVVPEDNTSGELADILK